LGHTREIRGPDLRDAYEWAIAEYTPDVGDFTKEIIERAIVEMIGPPAWKYSRLELPLQLFDGLLSKVCGSSVYGWDAIVFRKLGDLWKTGVICSKTANRPLVKAGIFPERLSYGSPDDSYDFVTTSLDWRISSQSPGWISP